MLTQSEKDLKKLSELVVEASLYWTGEAEEEHPVLKKIRTLAGMHIDDFRKRGIPVFDPQK